MVRIVGFSLLYLLTLTVVAQNLQQIDSLRKLAGIKSGTEQFEILSTLAWEYRLVSPDSTIAIGKRAYELGKRLELKKNLSRPLNFIGVGYEYKAFVIDAYEYFKQALTTATLQNDEIQIAYANNNLGRLFLDQGNILKALEANEAALAIFKSHNDLSGIASTHLSLAQLYQSQKDFEKAEEYFLKVYETRYQLEHAPNISAITQLGIFYRESGDIKKADKFLHKADSLCAVRKNEVLRANINFQIAKTRLLEKKYSEAEAVAKKAIEYSVRKGINTARIYNVWGQVKFHQGDYEKAKEYFNKVLNSTKTFKDSDIKMDAHFYLFKIYSKEGATEKKLHNENQYLALKDSLKEIELTKQIEKLKFQFNLELEQKRRENELLKTLDSRNTDIIRKQQTINAIYAAALLVIVGVAFMLFRNAKTKNRLNVELEKKQEKILRQSEELRAINLEIEKINANLEKTVEERTKTIKEKNKLLTEYAYFNSHQIRGPLARILGLIHLLNMEYKDSFGGHLAMLQQAGTDLDDAIHTINKLIDDVSE